MTNSAAVTGDPHAALTAVQAAGDTADATTSDNLQNHEGAGFTWETRHIRLKRARFRRALPGPSAWQLDAIGAFSWAVLPRPRRGGIRGQ